MIEPCLTCFRIFGCNCLASTPLISSAHTFPLLHRMPKTGCLVVPLPRFDWPGRHFTAWRLFFHWPPQYVSSTSTVPSKTAGTSWTMSILTTVNIFKSMYREILTRERIVLLECSRRNSWITFLSVEGLILTRFLGSLKAFRQAQHLNRPSLKIQYFSLEHFGQCN